MFHILLPIIIHTKTGRLFQSLWKIIVGSIKSTMYGKIITIHVPVTTNQCFFYAQYTYIYIYIHMCIYIYIYIMQHDIVQNRSFSTTHWGPQIPFRSFRRLGFGPSRARSRRCERWAHPTLWPRLTPWTPFRNVGEITGEEGYVCVYMYIYIYISIWIECSEICVLYG